MPESAIGTPAVAAAVDRLALGSEMIRSAQGSTYSYTLPGPGCFEADASTYSYTLPGPGCFEVE